jgi:hypothetical protein
VKTRFAEVRIKGKDVIVPSIQVNQRTIVVTGKWIKTAAVRDEDVVEGEAVDNPEFFITMIKEAKLNADIFTFAQKVNEGNPKYKYHMEWDNAAAIRITSFEDWWGKRLPQVTRKSIRRGKKRGVIARECEFNDDLLKGIIDIHNESPMRQGMPFVYYGKDLGYVKNVYGTYLDRSEFIGAYFSNKLIGFLKLIYSGEIASIIHIVSETRHYDKRPTNILIARAVEVCEQKGISFLVHNKYVYGKKTQNSLTEFKRRNGFERIDFPRYYIPLTLKGQLALKLNLHLGLIGILPGAVIPFLRDLRSTYFRIKLRVLRPGDKIANGSEGDKSPEMEDGRPD